jgi:hypothetical protein
MGLPHRRKGTALKSLVGISLLIVIVAATYLLAMCHAAAMSRRNQHTQNGEPGPIDPMSELGYNK